MHEGFYIISELIIVIDAQYTALSFKKNKILVLQFLWT